MLRVLRAILLVRNIAGLPNPNVKSMRLTLTRLT